MEFLGDLYLDWSHFGTDWAVVVEDLEDERSVVSIHVVHTKSARWPNFFLTFALNAVQWALTANRLIPYFSTH